MCDTPQRPSGNAPRNRPAGAGPRRRSSLKASLARSSPEPTQGTAPAGARKGRGHASVHLLDLSGNNCTLARSSAVRTPTGGG